MKSANANGFVAMDAVGTTAGIVSEGTRTTFRCQQAQIRIGPGAAGFRD